MKRIYFLPLLVLLCGWAACLRPSDSPLPVSHSAPFVNGDLKKALANTPSLKLFNQAFLRLGLDQVVDSGKGYTIFAPTDSTLTAAGLDAAKINSLSIDSLRKLITYHIITAAMDELAFQNALLSVKATALRTDTSFSQPTGSVVKPYSLYVQETGDFYFNGFPVAKGGDMIPTSNGYIFPITKILYPYSDRSLTDIITEEPDLSLYYTALHLCDSIRKDYYFQVYGEDVSYDSTLFELTWLRTPPTLYYGGSQPTVFAPTNKAFNAAGFHTADDLLQYAMSGARYGYTDDFTGFYYSPLDSLLARHILYSAQVGTINYRYPSLVLYGDLQHPEVNNGIYNVYWGHITQLVSEGYNLRWMDGLQFSSQQGQVSMSWHNQTISVPGDDDQQTSHRNFLTPYGALYKIDKIFYPIH